MADYENVSRGSLKLKKVSEHKIKKKKKKKDKEKEMSKAYESMLSENGASTSGEVTRTTLVDKRTKAEIAFQQRKEDKVMVFMCQTCGKSLSTKYNLVRHMNVHAGKGKHTCCGLVFPDNFKLYRHRASKHGDPRNYVCKSCPKDFSSQTELNEHEKSHNKEAYLTCIECDHRARGPRDLREHMAKHSGNKRYQCDQCDKGYKFRQSLSQHRKTHES